MEVQSRGGISPVYPRSGVAAHLGSQRMLGQLRRLHYWPSMRRDIDAWCRQCEGCAISRGPPSRPHGHLRKISAGALMDLVAIDILSGLPTTADGHKYLLVANDYFTKWLEAIPLCDAEAHTCMRTLYGAFFSRFGLPRKLHSDQGGNCQSNLVAELCSIAGINKTRTTPFHPRSDGQTERANRSGRIGPLCRYCVPRSMRRPNPGQITRPHYWRPIVCRRTQ